MKPGPIELSLAERRRFLQLTASAAGFALAGCGTAAARGADSPKKAGGEEAEVTPGEDLMQEHGVISRILLVYDEASRRIDQGKSLDLKVITTATDIIRRFAQDYHELNEETHVFPRLQKAEREGELVAVLLRQHERGRQLNEDIEKRAKAGESAPLPALMRSFVRMYRPHAAWEDTVLFPAFREVVGRQAYMELGEQLEKQEHELFGEDGFRKIVEQVAGLERTLEIHDLASFTPA